MHDLIPLPASGTLTTELAAELDSAGDYAAASLSEATRRAYAEDAMQWRSWCARHGLQALPAQPEAVAAHIAAMADAGLKPASIARRVAAIRYLHRLADLEPPTNSEKVRATLRGTAPDRKAPATHERIKAMLVHCDPATTHGIRDRALLLLGFACALRRSEIVALTVADLEEAPGGIVVNIRRSKTDQEGQGQQVPLPYGHRLRPVEALQTWIEKAGITEGVLFRRISPGGIVLPDPLRPPAVAAVVKRYCAAAGLPPASYAGHSLRAGFVTSAVEDGASAVRVAEITRHRSLDTVTVYVRRLDAFKAHPGEGFL
jgi:site-specific recombinase XerD